MKIHFIKFIAIFFLSMNCLAIEKSASDTAREFYDLLKQENYSTAATYYSPGALREFRQLMNFENELARTQKQFFFEEYFEPDLNDASAKNLSDTDFMAAFLNGMLTSDNFSQMLNYNKVDILGEITERSDLAHVLVRQWISLGGHKMEVVEVTSFNKVGGDWKIRMTGRLKGVAIMIRQQLLW